PAGFDTVGIEHVDQPPECSFRGIVFVSDVIRIGSVRVALVVNNPANCDARVVGPLDGVPANAKVLWGKVRSSLSAVPRLRRRLLPRGRLDLARAGNGAYKAQAL